MMTKLETGEEKSISLKLELGSLVPTNLATVEDRTETRNSAI